jgi:hypothetical protein
VATSAVLGFFAVEDAPEAVGFVKNDAIVRFDIASLVRYRMSSSNTTNPLAYASANF